MFSQPLQIITETTPGTYQKVVLETLKGTVLDRQTLAGSKISKCSYEQMVFSECEFYACSFQEVIFENCVFENCNFSFSHMHNCKFINCSFVDCNWTASTKTNVVYEDAYESELLLAA
jgi:uncharacterized protein YjbI with pentapeptide repeats